jgi:acetolactate synthase-1/2/3 large subunit
LTIDPDDGRAEGDMGIQAGLAVATMLRDYGARFMFGMPGGQHYAIYAGIHQLQPSISHIGFRTEKDAAFAAYGYALVSGRPGICDGTVGPGATNLASGVAEAWAASTPVIAISGDVPTHSAGRWAAQEVDMPAVLRPFTKAVLRVEHVERIPDTVRMAFRIATSGRPGPVHLIVPADVIEATHEFDDLSVEAGCAVYPSFRGAPDPAAVEAAADRLLAAQRPVLFAGGGVLSSGATAELRALAERIDAPVATSMMGKGSIPEDHPLSLGAAVSFYGPDLAYQSPGVGILADADLIVFVGSRTDEGATAGWRVPRPGTPVIHIDVDPREIGRTYPVEVGIVADARLALAALDRAVAARADGRTPGTGAAARVAAARAAWQAAVEPRLASADRPITGHRVVREIERVIGDDGIVVTDASLAPYFAGAFLQLHTAGRRYLSPRGLGSLGAGLPMTIGAKVAAPDRVVVGFGGDGGLGMALGEFETMAREGIAATYVVLNNSALGYGVMTVEPVVSHHYAAVDYSAVARALGCHGVRVEDPEEVGPALREAVASGRPALIEVISAIELPTTAGGLVLGDDGAWRAG